MTARSVLARVALQEDLNFLLTNRIPRQLATQFVGWFSKIDNPLVRDLSIGAVAPVRRPEPGRGGQGRRSPACTTASSASSSRARARSIPIPRVLVSPCDAIVGACGRDRRRPS